MSLRIDPSRAVAAYFARIEGGNATAEEYQIFPRMLERFESLPVEPGPEPFAGISKAGKKGVFPQEGLVNAAEVMAFLGKKGLKRPTESLMKIVRDGKFPRPVDMSAKPLLWRAQDVHRWLKGEWK